MIRVQHHRRPLAGRSARLATTLLLLGVMAGCGGGGGGGGSSSGAPPAPPPGGGTPPPGGGSAPPSLQLAATSFAASGSTVDDTAPATTIHVALSQPSAIGYIGASFAGTAVAAYGFSNQTTSGFDLSITLLRPGQLGAGTYTDTLKLQVCVDAGCTQQFGGSPASIAVQYVVSGSAQPTTTFSIVPLETQFTATTADAQAPTGGIQITVTDLPPAGVYAIAQWPANSIVASGSFYYAPCSINCVSPAWATLNYTLESPGQLGMGIYSGSITLSVCWDQACTMPLAGSPHTVDFTYTVTGGAGKDYTAVTASIAGAVDVAYDKANQTLYAAVQGISGGSVVAINPSTGASGATLSLSSKPDRIAISDDGTYAYVGLPSEARIERVHLPDLTADLSIPLGVDASNQPLRAAHFAVAPGEPTTLAVALASQIGDVANGIVILDGATARTQSLAPLNANEIGNSVAWGDTASTLYALRSDYPTLPESLDTLSVTAAGIAVTNAAANANVAAGYYQYEDIWYAGGRVYANDGSVLDPSSGALLGAFVGPPQAAPIALVPDVTLGRAYVLYHDPASSHLVLWTFDLASFTRIGLVDLGYDTGTIDMHLIRFGTNGLAFADGSAVIILTGTVVGP